MPMIPLGDCIREGHYFRKDTPVDHVKHNILLSREWADDQPADRILARFRENDLSWSY
jgi:hypothetical protein